MQNELLNDWRPEVTSLLKRMLAAGFTLDLVGDGESPEVKNPTLEQTVAMVTGVDEAFIYVTPPKSKKSRWVYLVLGNSPGELVSDYTCDDEIDAVSSAHYNEWEKKPQPKATAKELYGR